MIAKWLIVRLGGEAVIQPGKVARIRVQFGASVNMFCYMLLEL